MLLNDVPTIAAHHEPTLRALWFEGRTLTYAQLRDRCFQLSNALATIASPGDRIAILSENCQEYVEAYYGVPGAAMALTFLNYRLSPRELTYILNDSAPSVVIVEPKYLETIRKIRGDLTSVKTVVLIGESAPDVLAYDDLIARGAAREPAVRADENDMAWLLYTSGTTGLPKGAMLTHKSILASCMNMMSRSGPPLDIPEVALFMFPQFHVAGYVMPVYHLRNLDVILLRTFDARTLLKTIEEHKVTSAAMAPTMLAMVLEDPETDQYDLSSLRNIGYGASSMPAEIIRRANRKWPKVAFGTGFGMTELSGNVMALSNDDHMRAAEHDLPILRSVGKQLPWSRVRVIDENDQDCPPGVPGELVVKGDQVLKGYWNNPEATEKSFVDGWFRSGDLARWDEDGYLYIVDRKKDMILTGGENVYPREVEEVLYEHPAVIEAAVVGAPDEKWGEKVVAVIRRRLEIDVTEGEIITFCKERIASYKKPKHVVFITGELPKNASGKVLKRVLRDQMASGELPFQEG